MTKRGRAKSQRENKIVVQTGLEKPMPTRARGLLPSPVICAEHVIAKEKSMNQKKTKA